MPRENKVSEMEDPPSKKSSLNNFFKKLFNRLLQKKPINKVGEIKIQINEFLDKNLSLSEDNQNLQKEIKELEMIKDLILFYDIILEEIKVPRNKIIGIEKNDLNEIFNFLKNNKISNIIIYDDNLDNIKGFIKSEDLLLLKIKDEETKNPKKIENLIKDVLFVPPTMKAFNLLSQMKETKIYMAILIDEHGGTDGLVTINDIFSEIIGGIDNNYYNQSSYFKKNSENEFYVNALIPLDFLEKKIGLLRKDDKYEDIETLNGLIISMKNCIPNIGDEIILNDEFSFKILEKDDRIIQKILIKKHSL